MRSFLLAVTPSFIRPSGFHSSVPLGPGAVLVALLLLVLSARADTTNGLSDAEMQGRGLALKTLEQAPAVATNNFVVLTNSGVLQIRSHDGTSTQVTVVCDTYVLPGEWTQLYEARFAQQTNFFYIIHTAALTNIYFGGTNTAKHRFVPVLGDLELIGHFEHGFKDLPLSSSQLSEPFAGSDFWLGDLGLEFLHWPGQQLLPKTTNLKRGREYSLLESTSPNPAPGGYSRVVSWIDKETGGILEAEAYDASGKKLKDFEPKSFEKVGGKYQVKTLIMDNVQTESRSELNFDLGD